MLSLSLSKKSYHYQIYHCLKVKPSFHDGRRKLLVVGLN